MFLGNLLLALTVVVGLLDGKQVSINDPKFAGFIESREGGDAVLLYRDKAVRGEMKISAVQRIDFDYRKGKPFLLTVTLKNGQKLDVETASRQFVTIKGDTGSGSVVIKHPDPVSGPVRISSRKLNRKKDLTIQYLEFPR